MSGVLRLLQPADRDRRQDPTSPNYGDLYVPDFEDGIVNKFDSAGGHLLTSIVIGAPTGVAVDPTTGDRVYVTSCVRGTVDVYDATGTDRTSFPTADRSPVPTGIAVDSAGKVFVVNGGGFAAQKAATEIYSSSGTDLGQFDPGTPAYGVAVDPTDGHIYLDRRRPGRPSSIPPEIRSASPTGQGGTTRARSASRPMAASCAIWQPEQQPMSVTFGPASLPPDPSTDNPLVIDSVS